jgi:hypothetical protein
MTLLIYQLPTQLMLNLAKSKTFELATSSFYHYLQKFFTDESSVLTGLFFQVDANCSKFFKCRLNSESLDFIDESDPLDKLFFQSRKEHGNNGQLHELKLSNRDFEILSNKLDYLGVNKGEKPASNKYPSSSTLTSMSFASRTKPVIIAYIGYFFLIQYHSRFQRSSNSTE